MHAHTPAYNDDAIGNIHQVILARWDPLHKCKVSTNCINMVLFDSFSGTDQGTVEPQNYFGFFRRAVHVQSFQSLALHARALRDEHYLQTSLHSIELNIKIYKTLF